MFMDKKFLKMRDGIELYVEVKESSSPIWIVATHGISEHLGRHSYLPALIGHDYNVFQYDLRGHGRSSGARAFVLDFSLYMEDLKEILHFLKEKYRMERYVLFGHSMGALIHCAFMQNYVESSYYPEAFILSAPPCGASGIFGKILKIIPVSFLKTASNLPYSFPFSGLVDLNYLSHDPRVKEEYIKDELNFLKPESKLVFELIKTAQTTFSKPIRSKCPNFVMVGGSDKIIGASDVIEFFTNIDKSFNLKVFDGAYHEMHHEIEKYKKPYLDHLKKILSDIIYRA